MGVYLYPNNTETELKNAYIGIPNPTSIVLDKSFISLTTIGQTEQLTATIEPTVSDKTITWTTSDSTVATVVNGLVTCVTPGECTITATTVNGLTASCSVTQSIIPSAYQEVEYIQSSGTQYFVVGTSFKASYKTILDFQITQSGQDYVLVGIYDSYNKYGVNSVSGYLKVANGGNTWSDTASYDTNRHTLTIDNGTVTVDGTNYSVTYGSHTYSKGLGVFGYNTGTDIQDRANMKLYKLDIYDENGTHIYELVPCYRKSDDEIGMYDLVNDQFYTNSGTGTFTKGPDVN